MKLLVIKFLFLALILISLNCFEQTITISNDFRGIINYKIIYNKDYEKLLSYVYEMHNLDLKTYVFFDKKRVQEILTKNNNFKLLDYSITDNANAINSDISLTYNDLKNFPEDLPLYFFPVKAYEENNTIYYDTTIALSKLSKSKDIRTIYRNLKENDKKIIDSYLELIQLKFIYKSENPIISANIGNISQDKKELIYSTNIYEQLNNKNDTEITFSFKK